MAGFSPIPDSVSVVPIRPLSKGMMTNLPSNQIDDGAFVDVRNFLAQIDGLKRRSGWAPFGGVGAAPYIPRDYVTLWRTTGDQISLLLTEFSAYKVNPLTGITEVVRAYTTGTSVSVAGIAVTGTGAMAWNSAASDLMVGDVFRANGEEGIIASIIDATHLTLEAATIANGSYGTYSIQRGSGRSPMQVPDTAVFGNYLAITDRKRPLQRYDPDAVSGSEFSEWITSYPSTGKFTCECVAAFADRIWVGSTYDGTDGFRRQRLRWSTLANPRDFSVTTNYLDLPYVNGALRRLVPLGQYLVAYFDDAVYIGSQTNYPTLPIRFQRVETGNAGLAGPRAVISWLGGHFFVGQDDIYLLTTDGAQRIGTPIVKDSIQACKNPFGIYACVDPLNFRVVFGMPIAQTAIEKIWSYDYRSKGWSYETTYCNMIANPIVSLSLSWDTATGTWDAAPGTWDNYGAGADLNRHLLIDYSNALYKCSDAQAFDFTATNISGFLESKDYDFGVPDTVKAITRLSIKLREMNLDAALNFNVQVSVNRGRTWKTCGTLQIPVNSDEGYVSFRATGSVFRFRMAISAQVAPFTIIELCLKVRSEGSELNLGVSR